MTLVDGGLAYKIMLNRSTFNGTLQTIRGDSIHRLKEKSRYLNYFNLLNQENNLDDLAENNQSINGQI
jgi:hypothetical protein